MYHYFTVFIDESGDDGFVFRPPPDKGSSDWLIVSAVVSFSAHQKTLLTAADRIRASIGWDKRKPLHFADLSHEKRVRVIHELGKEQLRYVSVIIDKRNIRDVDVFRGHRGRLYYFALRLLLERVSWLCRDSAVKNGFPSPKARIIIEHRKRLKHDDLVDYVRLLRTLGAGSGWIATSPHDIRIAWDVIDEGLMEAAGKPHYVGLQFADFVASGTKMALEATPYGFTEHRYAKMMVKQIYSRSGNFTSYGLKFFPTLPAPENEFMHWIYKHCKG